MSVLITAAAGLLPASVASAAPSTIGSSGGADPYFPQQGNGGYDVKHYTLELRYAPAQGHPAGTAEVRAVAGQALTRFKLDLRHDMTASSVAVNGRPFEPPPGNPRRSRLRPVNVGDFARAAHCGGARWPVVPCQGPFSIGAGRVRIRTRRRKEFRVLVTAVTSSLVTGALPARRPTVVSS
jgi:hypothetical protein